jgi:transcriptional regulator with XRE-family HTH domain
MTQTRGLPEWAKNLKKFRKQQGYSQAGFGEKFQVTQQAVAKWEAGESEPPVAVLAWIVTVFTGTAEGQALLAADHVEMNGQMHSEVFPP